MGKLQDVMVHEEEMIHFGYTALEKLDEVACVCVGARVCVSVRVCVDYVLVTRHDLRTVD
jgi:hypothetical protein